MSQDYESALSESWKIYATAFEIIGEKPNEAFKWVFKRAYTLGKQEKDAEGEELLTVPRKDIVELYQEVQKTISQCKGTELAIQAIGIKNVLWSFFGSKCLPDDGDELSPEPKPAEPKFKVGNKIRIVKGGVFDDRIGEVTDIDFVGHLVYYKTDRSYEWLKESDLEPYTEPKEKPNPSNSGELKPEDVDKQFDNILKDSFSKELRLNIAAILAAGMLVSEVRCYPVDRALELADALIAECEKTDKNNLKKHKQI